MLDRVSGVFYPADVGTKVLRGGVRACVKLVSPPRRNVSDSGSFSGRSSAASEASAAGAAAAAWH